MLQIEYRKTVDIDQLKDNPRQISEASFDKLCQSIKKNKSFFEARPLILSDRTGFLVVIAGNQRLRAAIEIGMQEVPTVLIPGLTEEEEKEIIIRDNVSNGEWDFKLLKENWDVDLLEDWGLDVYWGDEEDPIEYDYSDKNKEIDIDDLSTDMTIKLVYPEDEYYKVKEQLEKIAASPEQAAWKLLGNE